MGTTNVFLRGVEGGAEVGEPRVCQSKQSNEVVCLEQGSWVEGGDFRKTYSTTVDDSSPSGRAQHG